MENQLKPLSERIYNCIDCVFPSGEQKVFYDSVEDKSKIKVMLLFQNPGGKVDREWNDGRFSNTEVWTKYNRDGFETWPSKYYLYFRELCINLKKRGLITQFPKKLGTDIMKEIYVTDAVKCKADVKNELERFKDSNGYNSISICSYNFFKEEIINLDNLQLIISCGNWANTALQGLVECNGYKWAPVKNGPFVRTLIDSYDLKPYQEHLNHDYSHGRIYDFDYVVNGSIRRKMKNIHFNHPSWFYNEGPLRNKHGEREKLIIKSMQWCFNKKFLT